MFRSALYTAMLATSLMVAPSPSQAAANDDLSPALQAGSEYTATLHTHSQSWRLSPVAGGDLDVRGADLCPHTEVPPSGLWLLDRDAEGNPQLVAPSITLLPDGHSGRVALRACDDPELQNAQVKAYGVPGNLLNLLISETGAILVDD
ncbi:MAG: hypothetical protein KDJ14_00910 [Xanthomonadales bacterium]|nr:hypothetical protein [Xanthomonadales bacterium]